MFFNSDKIFFVITFIFCYNVLFAQTPTENKFQLAQSYEQSGETKEALRIYEEIYSTDKQEKYFEPIVRLYKQENRFKELLPLVLDRTKSHPTAKIFILAGEIYWQLGEINDANSMWDKTRKDYGNTPDTYQSITLTLNQLKQFDKTIPILIEAKQKFFKNEDIIDALVRAYIFTNMYQDGFGEMLYLYNLTNNLQQAQSRLFALMTDTSALVFLNNAFIRELKKDDNLGILTLYSWYLRTTKNYEEAFNVVVKVDEKQNNKGRNIFQFANESRRDEEFDIALKAYLYLQNMGKNTPYYNNALYEYTQTSDDRLSSLIQNKNIDSVNLKKNFESIIMEYKRIIKDNPKTSNSEQSKMRIATIERNIMKNNKAAIEMLLNVIETQLDANYVMQATNDLVEVYIATGELSKANELINSVLADQNNTKNKGIKIKGNAQLSSKTSVQNNNVGQYLNEIKFNQAEILYYQGQIDSAMTIYASLLDSLSEDIVNDALTRISFIEQNKEHIKQLSIFAKAEYLVLQERYLDAIKEFDNIRKETDGESIAELSIIKIAETESKRKNNNAAKTILTNYLSENAHPLFGDNALFLLGNIAEEENDYIDAQKYYGDILYKFPRSIFISEARNKIRTIRGN